MKFFRNKVPWGHNGRGGTLPVYSDIDNSVPAHPYDLGELD